MEFLVQIDLDLSQLSESDLATKLPLETARGRELVGAGHIASMWRRAGRSGNIGVWNASDLEALHGLITSLPMFPYMKVEVTPLATHPLISQQVLASNTIGEASEQIVSSISGSH